MTTNPSIPEAAIEAGQEAAKEVLAPFGCSDLRAMSVTKAVLRAAVPHLLREVHSAIEHLHNDVGTLTDQLNRARDALQRIVTTPSVASPEAIAREALIALEAPSE